MTRDFSDAAKEKLIQQIKAVTPEGIFSKIGDFFGDLWLNLQEKYGDLNIQSYANDVDAYHQKILDKNNTEIRQIEEIFAAVHEVDESASGTLAPLGDAFGQQRDKISRLIDTLTIPTTQFKPTTIQAIRSGEKNPKDFKYSEPTWDNTEETRKRIWEYLVKLIGNEYGAAALMGNLACESALSAVNMQDSYQKGLGMDDRSYTLGVDDGSYGQFTNDGVGYGLAQWTWGPRKQKLLEYAKSHEGSVGNLDIQLQYLEQELKNDYPGVLQKLRNATSIEQASNVVLHEFERPQNQSASVEQYRASRGQAYYKQYHG